MEGDRPEKQMYVGMEGSRELGQERAERVRWEGQLLFARDQRWSGHLGVVLELKPSPLPCRLCGPGEKYLPMPWFH